MSLQHRFLVTATVGGKPLGGFQTFAGGENAAEDVKDRPPGSIYEESLGGPKGLSNITLTRTFKPDRDTDDIISFLDDQVGKGDAAIGRVPLDENMTPKGRGRTFTGKLIRFKGPDVDTNSNDKATIELEFSISGVA